MDKTTLFGIIFGIGTILFANILEGGHFSALFQLTAAIIVFGGTAGATIVSNSYEDIKRGVELFKKVFSSSEPTNFSEVSKEIVGYASLVRAESNLALDNKIKLMKNPFMKSVFRMVVDGVDVEVIKNIFEKRQDIEFEKKMAGAKIWVDAGGYAPTIGILGAVLGLIHVMSQLTDTSALGQGIAVAFVATIYGVGSANLIFLPIASKIKSNVENDLLLKEMVLDGALGIASGLNPSVIQEKLNCYLK